MDDNGESTFEGARDYTTASTVQNAHSISTSQGNVVLAGGNVSIQAHYHGQFQSTTAILEALHLVPNLRKIHLGVLSKATAGTAIWILNTKYFLLWLDLNGTLKILWGTGIPGAGKSVMASVVINDLEARAAAAGGSVCVAYVYFRYSDSRDLTVRSVLEILVKQTVERHHDCAAVAQKVYARHIVEKTQPTELEMLQLLHLFTGMVSATFYVLDALDEAPERIQVDLIRTLSTLKTRLFITSRPLKAIEARVSDAYSFDIVPQEGDLDLHIKHEISRGRDLQDLLDEDPCLQDEIVFLIKRNCGGMFLHASLQLDAISRCSSAYDVAQTLASFPSDIEAVYRQTWSRICSQTPSNILLAKTMLIWVLNAARSMRVDELRYAIATHPDTHVFDRRRLVSAAALSTLCCGLIAVEEETKLVRLIHYTAKDTITRLLQEFFPHPHSLLAAVCMTHLTERRFQDTNIDSEQEFTSALRHDPLLAYASDAWFVHARKALHHPENRRRTETFVLGCKGFPSFVNPQRTLFFDILTSLHILAFHRLPLSLAEVNQAGGPNITTRKEKMTPLMFASWCGNTDIVQALLGLRDIQVNLINNRKNSALIFAASEGHSAAVRLLLQHSAIQANLVEGDRWSALMWASNRGHEGVVELLLDHPTTQVNLINNKGSSALIKAANRGHEAVVRSLLNHPAIEVNLVDFKGWSALMKAASRGHDGVVSLLLGHSATRANLVNNDKWSALMMSVHFGHKNVSQLLLAHHAIQVNIVDSDGWSALMFAASEGHESDAKLLLDHPMIHVNLVDNQGWSALIRAANQGHESVVKLLLDHPMIQVNVVDSEGCSALIHAANGGYQGVIKALLDHPATEVNLVDSNGRSALIFAAARGHEEAVKVLLAHHETQLDLAAHSGETPLAIAELFGHESVARLLSSSCSIDIGTSV